MASDRRKKPRFESKLFAEIIPQKFNKNPGRGVVIDVSVTGFAIDTELDLEPGEYVNCHIEIPLQIKARVMRQVKEGQVKRYGLKIEGQGLWDRLLIRKLLKGPRTTKKV